MYLAGSSGLSTAGGATAIGGTGMFDTPSSGGGPGGGLITVLLGETG